MISVLTVCGNGIGSSLMLKMKIEEICAENGIDAQVESIDFNAAQGRKADLIVTVKSWLNNLTIKMLLLFVAILIKEDYRRCS